MFRPLQRCLSFSGSVTKNETYVKSLSSPWSVVECLPVVSVLVMSPAVTAGSAGHTRAALEWRRAWEEFGDAEGFYILMRETHSGNATYNVCHDVCFIG